jgi:hypothetical protein
MPGDFGSPHWYDLEAFTDLVGSYADLDTLSLGEFIGRFAGLRGTAKAKAVRAAAGVTTFARLREHPEKVAVMLAAMKDKAKAPPPSTLGAIGSEHLESTLDAVYGVTAGTFRYKKKELVADGIPWLIEAAVAETAVSGDVQVLLNHSPVIDDPLAWARLASEGYGLYPLSGAGVWGLLSAAGVKDSDELHYAAVVHLICPVPKFKDPGKTTLDTPAQVNTALADLLSLITKPIQEAQKKSRRQRRAEINREIRRARELDTVGSMTSRDAVFQVMAQAFAKASGPRHLPVPARSLFYQVRPLAQQLTEKPLTDDYFSKLLVEYQQEHGPLVGLTYEPRGTLHEPHTGKSIPLGTTAVANYTPPDYLYDKVMLVEKVGLQPVLAAARLGERYDMGIMPTNGYTPQAARDIAALLHHSRGSLGSRSMTPTPTATTSPGPSVRQPNGCPTTTSTRSTSA